MNNLTIKEIATEIKKDIKKELKGCKFSITTGNGMLRVYLMSTPYEILKDDAAVSDYLRLFGTRWYSDDESITIEEFKERFSNDFCFTNKGKDSERYFTEEFLNVLNITRNIVRKYYVNDSDVQRDYYNDNFMFDLNVGKEEKFYTVK